MLLSLKEREAVKCVYWKNMVPARLWLRPSHIWRRSKISVRPFGEGYFICPFVSCTNRNEYASHGVLHGMKLLRRMAQNSKLKIHFETKHVELGKLLKYFQRGERDLIFSAQFRSHCTHCMPVLRSMAYYKLLYRWTLILFWAASFEIGRRFQFGWKSDKIMNTLQEGVLATLGAPWEYIVSTKSLRDFEKLWRANKLR
jgi:hypothetical protein